MMIKKKVRFMIFNIFILSLAMIYCLLLRAQPNTHYAQVFYHQSQLCAGGCSIDKRFELAKQVVYHDWQFSAGHTLLGGLYAEAKEPQKAFLSHLQAVHLNHKNKRSLLQVGIYLFQQKRFDEALRYLNHSYSISQNGSYLNYYLGRIYEKKGDYKKSSYLYLRAHQLDLNNTMAMARSGALDSLGTQKDKALRWVERIRKAGGEDLADELERYIMSEDKGEFKPNED